VCHTTRLVNSGCSIFVLWVEAKSFPRVTLLNGLIGTLVANGVSAAMWPQVNGELA
jgi:hypothetical protein